jgi:hypothetical protein
VAAVRVTSLLSMDMLRNTFVTTVARFTQLHSPASMALKNAQAFRALLVIADENGNHLGVRSNIDRGLQGLGFEFWCLILQVPGKRCKEGRGSIEEITSRGSGPRALSLMGLHQDNNQVLASVCADCPAFVSMHPFRDACMRTAA